MFSSDPKVDFHLHTTASDGLLSPAQMVRAAREAGMDWIAITDHDTVAGLPEAIAAGQAAGLSVLAGLELSCGISQEVHLLGYGFRPEHPRLLRFLREQTEARQDRMCQTLKKLTALHLPVENFLEPGARAFPGRMTLARAMVRAGHVATSREAFTRFLGEGRPAYVQRPRLPVAQGVALLRACGAVVALAHPGRLTMDAGTLGSLLPSYKEAGLDALEVYYPRHLPETLPLWAAMAKRNGLLAIGGSDCHDDGAGCPRIGAHLGGWHTLREDARAFAALLAERGTDT